MGIFDKAKEAFERAKASDEPVASDEGGTDLGQLDSTPQTDQVPGQTEEVPPEIYVPSDSGAASDSDTTAAPDQSAGESSEQLQPAEPVDQPVSVESSDAMQPSQPPAEPAAAPEPAAPEAAAAPEPETYVVVEGDNLTFIGERFGVSVDALVAANNIENPDLIFPGQVLTIPR